MQRRDFLKSTCTACVALGAGLLIGSLESCGTALNVTRAKASNNQLSIPLSELQAGGVKLVRVDGYPFDLALQKQSDGGFQALVLACTHAGHPLNKTGHGYFCTLHGSQFAETGAVTKGPAETPLMKLDTHADAANVYVALKPFEY